MSNLIPVHYGKEFQFFVDHNGKRVWDDAAVLQSMSELLHEMADAETFSTCYFIGCEAGPIKIGHSINVGDRLHALQMCSPVKLSLLAVRKGGAARETAYHHEFRDRRLHGEWFERCPEIEAEIARLVQPQGGDA